MKGIILAGGSGTRLFPVTIGVCKQLLPVYDKPMIYYPLSTLMLSGIREVLIITTPRDTYIFRELLGDGSQLGIHIEYAVQEKPEGIAQAFIVAEMFIGKSNVSLILGDNIFFGHGMGEILKNSVRFIEGNGGACIFGYFVRDPERYGVAEFDIDQNVISIEEKPKSPKSNYAITGLYFYDNSVVDFAKTLKPSVRNELEITDINNLYLKNNKLKVEKLSRGFAWLDTGTHESLLEASNFIETIEKRQGLKVACVEEISFDMGYIDASQLKKLGEKLKKNEYGKYLIDILERV